MGLRGQALSGIGVDSVCCAEPSKKDSTSSSVEWEQLHALLGMSEESRRATLERPSDVPGSRRRLGKGSLPLAPETFHPLLRGS